MTHYQERGSAGRMCIACAKVPTTKCTTECCAGSHAINPATGEAVPIWVADYVLGSYGSGAIMAVPAHDTRDFEFATQYGLPVVRVVQGPSGEDDVLPFAGLFLCINCMRRQ